MLEASSITPTCPRCGYDQSGDAHTWTDRCPVRGQCPECGTGFAWADLFDPTRQDIPWLIEHGRGVWTKAKRTIPTLLRASMPWMFWKRVGTHARPEPKGAILWSASVTLLLFALSLPAMAVMIGFLNRIGWPFSWRGFATALETATPTDLLFETTAGALWPVAWVERSTGFGWTINHGPTAGLFRLFRILVGPGLLWAVILGVVPSSRRLAKLSRAHVFRACVYHIALVVAVVLISRPLIFATQITNAGGLWVFSVAGLSVLVWIWSLIWWGCAVRIGWNIRSPLLLILGTIAAILGSIVLPIVEDSVLYMFRGF